MTECHLCQKKEANQKNSHLIPFFLIKHIVTPGEGKRTEKDIAFDLSNPAIVKAYYGRDVAPEEIQAALGRDLTDAEIRANKNPFTADNLICSECEKKIAVLESMFVKGISGKFSDFWNKPTNNDLILDQKDSVLLKTFLYSVIWRIGASDFGGNKMSRLVLERLRKILDATLRQDPEKLLNSLQANYQEINRHKVAISYYGSTSESFSKFIFFQPRPTNPYSFLIGNITFFFFLKKKSILRTNDQFYGLETAYCKRTLFKSEGAVITRMNREILERSVNQMMELIIKNKIQTLRSTFQEVYLRLHGTHAPVMLTNKYMGELIGPDYEHLDKLGYDRVVALTQRYCN